MAILHPECKQPCNSQLPINKLKGIQKVSSKKHAWVRLGECSQLRKYQIHGEGRKNLREQLAEQAQLLTAHGQRREQPVAHATHLQTTEARKYSENHLWHLKAFVCCDLWPLCGLSQVGFWSVSEKMRSSETCTEKSRFRPMFLARKSFLSANCHEVVCGSFIRCKCKSPLQCWGLNVEPRIAQYVFYFQRKQNIS